jgi:hypothetical protein
MSNLSCGKPVPSSLAGSHDDARATLRRLVNATFANLAEMDRLLERAERLSSRELPLSRSVPRFGEGARTRVQALPRKRFTWFGSAHASEQMACDNA